MLLTAHFVDECIGPGTLVGCQRVNLRVGERQTETKAKAKGKKRMRK